MFWPRCFSAHLKGRSFPSSAYYTSKGILRFAKPHSINLSTTFLPTRLCTRRSPEQHLQGRFKNEMMTFYCKIIANGIDVGRYITNMK